MGYKEKYEQALERAKNLRKDAIDMGENIRAKQCEIIFPELKEDEDEKIRKALIQYIKNWKANIQGKVYTYLWSSDKEECNKLLAWLEKQGEQKNKINSCKFTFEDILALECSMKTAKITKGGDKLYKILVPLYNKIHNAYLFEKQGEKKPTEFKWSKDDKNKLLIIEQILNCANLLISSQELTEIKNWLKSLKQRIGG